MVQSPSGRFVSLFWLQTHACMQSQWLRALDMIEREIESLSTLVKQSQSWDCFSACHGSIAPWRSLMLLPSVPVKIALLGKRHWYYWMMPRGTWHPWSLGIKMLRSGWANNVWSAFKKKTSYKQKVLSMKMGGGHYSPECQGIYFLPLAFRTSNSLAQILKQHRARLDNWILNRILIWMCTTSCKN